jgi:hypothetical protein
MVEYAPRGIWGGTVTRPARIVVGEGRTAQQGLLRFVLEGEGFDVVGEARGTADLTGVIEANDPDVVVLDDGIGVMAVSMVHEVAPRAKVVLVWPSAVVPIGGDARVEPAKILRDLGPAVTHVLAPAAALTETFERPEWIDRIRKDPATLRDKLGSSKPKGKRPSVTHLQRRSKRLHTTGRRADRAAQELREDDIPAPVVVLPVGTGGADLEPVLDIGGGATASEFADEPVVERSEWNRRLGTLALSGAAAVSALVLAVAIGGGRVPVSILRGADNPVPIGVPGFGFQAPARRTPVSSTEASVATWQRLEGRSARTSRCPERTPRRTMARAAATTARATTARAAAAAGTAAAGGTAAAMTAAAAEVSQKMACPDAAATTTPTVARRGRWAPRRPTGLVSAWATARNTTTSTEQPLGDAAFEGLRCVDGFQPVCVARARRAGSGGRAVLPRGRHGQGVAPWPPETMPPLRRTGHVHRLVPNASVLPALRAPVR